MWLSCPGYSPVIHAEYTCAEIKLDPQNTESSVRYCQCLTKRLKQFYIFVFLKEIWEPRGYEVALPRLLKFLFAAGDHEAACPAAMQEPA